jgi:two-component system response regulator FixJ
MKSVVAAATSATVNPESEKPIQKQIIFLVEQDAAVSRSIAMLLRHLPVTVKIFASVESMLEQQACDDTVDCVIIEIELPGISGLELLTTMRRRGIRTPVIVLCANSDVATAVAAMRAGADDFIEKPFLNRYFLDCVQRVLNHSNAAGAPATNRNNPIAL